MDLDMSVFVYTKLDAITLPVFISYEYNKKRYEKYPDQEDIANIQAARDQANNHWLPISRMPIGEESRRNDDAGLTHTHHFFPSRTLHVLSSFHEKLRSLQPGMLGCLTSIIQRCSWQNRYMPQHRGNRSREVVGPLSGTLYIPYFALEINPIQYIQDKGFNTLKQLNRIGRSNAYISTQSASSLARYVENESVDYVFVDPPFGSNLQYSELSFLMESWLRLWTCQGEEAVINGARGTDLEDYTRLMRHAFEAMYKALKRGRWVTVEFHNSQNIVWNSIQNALLEAGFMVADVRTLDKKKGTTKQLTLANAVQQDLIISAYKPDREFESKFKLQAGTSDGCWEFISSHLQQLPVFVTKHDQAEAIAERQNFLLFDRMVAFHIQRGVTIPLSASEFYAGLDERFPHRDGMYFLPDQIAEYDRKRMTVKEMLQLDLFVNDESTAVQWLRQQLTKKPQTFQDLHPGFLKAIGGWAKHETTLELSDLLEQNFLRYEGGNIPKQIVSWLAKSSVHRAAIAKVLGQESGVRSQESGEDEGQTAKLLDLVPDTGLETRDAGLLAAARDRWYIPDPNKAGDLEKLREKALLKEFEEYRTTTKKLKVFRMEAMRAGFKHYFQQRDYKTIIQVARKVPDTILQEDPKLLMFYDNAVTRAGEE